MPDAISPPQHQPSEAIARERVDRGFASLRGASDYVRSAELFRALGDPSRVKIADMLLSQELCTSDLAEVTGLSESAVSQHLRVLRMLRIVTSHRHGHRVFHTLDDEHVRNLLELTMAHLRDEFGPRHAG